MRKLLHQERLEDHSEVEAIMVEARTVERRLISPEKPDNYNKKVGLLKKEVDRLQEIGPDEWTEYQVLSLNQLLIDFLKIDELQARALSSLEDLQEYADDRYDKKHYQEWDERIKGAIGKIKESKKKNNDEEKDKLAETLRGELRTLLEHVADYDRYWAEGTAITRELMRCGVFAIPLLLVMGLMPLLHPAGSDFLLVLNWGLLGTCGAITSVLWSIRKTEDLVEVGNTKGRREVWNAVLGAGLGLVAGVILYAMIAGEILAGSAFPSVGSFAEKNISEQGFIDVARSIFWGLASGFSFEWIFDKVRSAKDDI